MRLQIHLTRCLVLQVRMNDMEHIVGPGTVDGQWKYEVSSFLHCLEYAGFWSNGHTPGVVIGQGTPGLTNYNRGDYVPG